MERYNSSLVDASLYAPWNYQTQPTHNAVKESLDRENDNPSERLDNNESNSKRIDFAHDENVIASEINSLDEDEAVRRSVWSDVDDELYIANLIKERTTNEVIREKRDSFVSDSDISEKVVSSVRVDYEMWELEPTDLTECDCLGPPPEFLLPPPPRPPFLQAEYYCGDDPIPDLETCDTEPVSF